MSVLKIGDIVARKSYGGDLYFRIMDIKDNGCKPVYILKCLSFRLMADALDCDLVLQNPKEVYPKIRHDFARARQLVYRKKLPALMLFLLRLRERPGKILHIDSDSEYLDICMKHYREANITAIGKVFAESQQPQITRKLLEDYRPNILVLTGHDSMKKNASQTSLESYSNSKYFVQSVKEARKYRSSPEDLCIFAGACQSYFEAIMDAGANFASSPGRILINVLDPSIVSEKIALTDWRKKLNPSDVAKLTVTGSEGIGGIVTRGQLKTL